MSPDIQQQNGSIELLPGHGLSGPARAVLYLRVSTKEQAERGGESEGFSIPAQRDACRRKAEALGAVAIDEFVDRGESAKTADRPELQRMLRFLTEEFVQYVIVHKVDRLARNRVDDVQIDLAIRASGARLISCMENIDETPSGALLHGIMSSIAEFYSRNLATEVMKGNIQKLKSGGSVGRAPIGYLNIRKIQDGREIRTVEIDPDRAPYVTWAFQQYATCEWTTRTLHAEATRRGLVSRATAKCPEKPLVLAAFNNMLKNPYYKGTIRYKGIEYEGKHPRLIDEATFDAVQRQLEANNFAGEKRRIHHHYLKGSIFCGSPSHNGDECRSRLIVCHATSRSKTIYPYFICIGRQRDKTSCSQRAVLIDLVERKIEDYYKTVELSDNLRLQTEQQILQQITELREGAGVERKQLNTQRKRALAKRAKLLEAHYASAIPLELLKVEQAKISSELAFLEERLGGLELHFDLVERNLKDALALVTNLHGAYLAAPPRIRRLINQSLFEKFLITDEGEVTGELRAPFDLLLRAAGTAEAWGDAHVPSRNKPRGPSGPRGLSNDSLVGGTGLEPVTPSLSSWCSPN